jgi:hypothetical protein
MKTQREWLQEILRLSDENPLTEILFFVDSEAICNDWEGTAQKILKVEIDDCYEDGEEIHVGEDDIIEHFLAQLDDEDDEGLASKLFKEKAKEAIFVYLSA